MISQTFNIDCMEALREAPDNHWDLAICDPPYANSTDAINLVDCIDLSKQATARTNYKRVEWNGLPDAEYFTQLRRVTKHQIVWGANFFGLSGGYICWQKFGTAFGEAELAYCSKINSVRVFEYRWNGMLQEDMANKEQRIHPTQKPVALYKWLLTNYAKPGDRILDTHLGSGSSRIAAYDLGFDFTGYEKDHDYWLAQEKRFADHIKQPRLFSPTQPTPVQDQLFAASATV